MGNLLFSSFSEILRLECPIHAEGNGRNSLERDCLLISEATVQEDQRPPPSAREKI